MILTLYCKDDYEREVTMPVSADKENFGYGNTGRTTDINNSKYTTFKATGQTEFTPASSIDMSPYIGTVQPIKYRDPSAK